MKWFVRAGFRLVAVAVTLGLLQALVETLTFAFMYRGLLFAPYRFFTLQIYDAYTKMYFLAAEALPLPRLLDRFLDQGFVAKLALLPELAGINAFVGVVVGVVLAPFAGILRLRDEMAPAAYAMRAVAVIVGLELLVHVGWWAATVKLPLDATVAGVASNLARDAVFDGVLVALAVMLTSSLAMLGAGPRLSAVAVAATVAAAVVQLPAATAALGHARPIANGPSPARGYNVVLISIDSLRADHTSAYGYPRRTTPELERLAAAGVLFERCSSTTSWTLPAHMSLLTGRSLLGHGVVSDDRRLSSAVPTLAEAFAAAGYATAAVVSAPYLESRFGFGRGFDDYDDRTVSFATNKQSYKSVTAGLVNTSAEKWIAANIDRPFFLFLHYWDVHYDYAPGAPYDRMFDPDYAGDISGDDFYFNAAVNPHMDRDDLDHVVALYDGEIRLVDDHIAMLREVLERRGVADRTVLVVTSDHGEEFFEHGRKGHHRTLYEEVLHVPLIVYAPGLKTTPRRVKELASIIDVMPTVLGLTGVAVPERLEGVDFTGLIAGEQSEPRRDVIAELYRKGSLNVQVSLRRDEAKVIHHFNRRLLERYDLAADAGEVVALGADGAPVAQLVSAMRGWLDARWRHLARRMRVEGPQSTQLDEAMQETLRSLGYVQ